MISYQFLCTWKVEHKNIFYKSLIIGVIYARMGKFIQETLARWRVIFQYELLAIFLCAISTIDKQEHEKIKGYIWHSLQLCCYKLYTSRNGLAHCVLLFYAYIYIRNNCIYNNVGYFIPYICSYNFFHSTVL